MKKVIGLLLICVLMITVYFFKEPPVLKKESIKTEVTEKSVKIDLLNKNNQQSTMTNEIKTNMEIEETMLPIEEDVNLHSSTKLLKLLSIFNHFEQNNNLLSSQTLEEAIEEILLTKDLSRLIVLKEQGRMTEQDAISFIEDNFTDSGEGLLNDVKIGFSNLSLVQKDLFDKYSNGEEMDEEQCQEIINSYKFMTMSRYLSYKLND